jgi:hypothetical protein|uniref:VP4-like membrane fusion protein n=1 Tax=Pleomorphic virus ThalV2 TaxID=3115753 RepID=A0AAT9J7R8_9VIRU
MSNKRRAVMAAFMLTMLIGQTVAIPLIIPLAIGGIIGAGAIGYWLGLQKSEEYQQLIADYEAQLTSNTIQNDINTRLYLQEIYARDNNIIALGQDLLQYSRNYAWALAKYEALKVLDTELNNGSNFTTAKTLAKQKAHDAVYNYYVNVTKNIIALHNETVELISYALYNYSNIGISEVKLEGSHFIVGSGSASGYVRFDNNTGVWKNWRTTWGSERQTNFQNDWTEPETLNLLGTSFNMSRLDLIFDCPDDPGYTVHLYATKVYIAGDLVYNKTKYTDVLNAIDSEYNMINSNIDAYIDGLAQSYVDQWNITALIDPYILAGLLNQDLNETGYHGYAAAELALMGLNTTGINTTVNITVYDGGNATVMEGWLFTDWQGTLETGQNYTANSSYKWFFVTDGGVYDLTGYNFSVGSLKDWQGNSLTNVTLKRYVSHTGDVVKMYDELSQIRQLYEEYINNLQAMAAGGGSGGFDLSAWWASLDQTAKLGVVAVGAVGLYAVLRRK